MTVVRPVILSGGAGTRLWPLSSQTLPKQFLRLFNDSSLFDAVLLRSRQLPGSSFPIVVTALEYVNLVEQALAGPGLILSEPAPRNTGPAIVAAALASDPDDILVVMPSDHMIQDQRVFAQSVGQALPLAEKGGIVTFGIVPDRPETGYGWIEVGEAEASGFKIQRFVEKPSSELAATMLDGSFLWNSGIFIALASSILSEAEAHASEILSTVKPAMSDPVAGCMVLDSPFLKAPSISFDHAIMEQTTRGFVVPLDAGWNDVGSWQALWEISSKDGDGNSLSGLTVVENLTGSFVWSSTRPVAVIGLSDVIVVETEDGILVAPRTSAQDVGTIAKRLKEPPEGVGM